MSVHLVIQATRVAQVVPSPVPAPEGSLDCATVHALPPILDHECLLMLVLLLMVHLLQLLVMVLVDQPSVRSSRQCHCRWVVEPQPEGGCCSVRRRRRHLLMHEVLLLLRVRVAIAAAAAAGAAVVPVVRRRHGGRGKGLVVQGKRLHLQRTSRVPGVRHRGWRQGKRVRLLSRQVVVVLLLLVHRLQDDGLVCMLT